MKGKCEPKMKPKGMPKGMMPMADAEMERMRKDHSAKPGKKSGKK